MEIAWYGHACFRLRERDMTAVTDPYSRDLPYERPTVRADVVTISHDHPGHNYPKGFRGSPRVFDGPGEYEVKGVFITGIATFHDNKNGKKRGRNTVFVFDFGGVRVCHLGDLGHLLDQAQLETLGDIHVLMVPVGGGNSLGPAQAAEVISQIEPGIVVPMHYQTPQETARLLPLDRFLKEMGVAKAEAVPELKVTRSSVPDETEVVVLDCRAGDKE